MQTYSGVVRSTLDSTLENSFLKAVGSERSRRMLDLGRLLLETVSKDDNSCGILDISHINLSSVESPVSFNSIPANAAGETLDYRKFRTTK